MQSRLSGLHFLFVNSMRYRASYYFNIPAAVLFVIISVIITFTFLIPDDLIHNSLPVCEYKASNGKECSACGLTRSFCEISKGNLQNAERYNSASIPLFSAFVLYQILFIAYLIKYFRKKIFI